MLNLTEYSLDKYFMSEAKNDFEQALDIFDAPESKLRLEAIKRRFDLHENDAIWLYIVALEHYQRLYEVAPQQIRAAADAERERLQTEANLIVAKFAQQSAALLIHKINIAVTKRAAAALWGQRAAALAGAFSLAAAAATFAALMSNPIPQWVIVAHSEHSSAFMRMLATVWNAPIGWVITLSAFGATWAIWVDLTVRRVAERFNSERA